MYTSSPTGRSKGWLRCIFMSTVLIERHVCPCFFHFLLTWSYAFWLLPLLICCLSLHFLKSQIPSQFQIQQHLLCSLLLRFCAGLTLLNTLSSLKLCLSLVPVTFYLISLSISSVSMSVSLLCALNVDMLLRSVTSAVICIKMAFKFTFPIPIIWLQLSRTPLFRPLAQDFFFKWSRSITVTGHCE